MKTAGQKRVIPIMFGLVILIPLAAIIAGKDSYDIIRWFVLAQIATMIVFYIASIISDVEDWINFSGHGDLPGDAALARVISSRITRSIGIMVLLGADMWQITLRIGNDHFNPLTPVSQLALVFLINAWFVMDRVSLAPPKVVVDDEHDLHG